MDNEEDPGSIPKSKREKQPPRILILSKTEDEEKLGGPYKWARELQKGLENKDYPATTIRTNWKNLFNGEIFKKFKQVNQAK